MRMMPLGYEPPPRPFHANVQMVASAAHLRGVVLLRAGTIVGSVEAADLCRSLRAAHEATRGDDHAHAHVERLAFGITLRLGAQGAVQVSRSSMNLITGYAGRQKRKQEKRASSSSLALRGSRSERALQPGRCPRIADGGVKGSRTGAHDPSVADKTTTPPHLRWGGEGKRAAS